MVGAGTWKIWFPEISISIVKNHSWNPRPPLLLKGRGRTFQNLVGQNLLLERGYKPETGGCYFFYYFTVQFSHIYSAWEGSKVSLYYFSDLQSFELGMQDFHPCSHWSVVLKPGIICAFLIHSGSLQKMLTALFNLVWNTQKSKWTIFLSAKARCFLVLQRF